MDLVAELALTPERREQLLAWLGDMQLLQTEQPNVADYLRRTESMPGTGDIQADLAEATYTGTPLPPAIPARTS